MNIVSLVLLGMAGFLALQKRMLPYSVAMFFFAFLTVGQGLFFDRVIAEGGWIVILQSYVDWKGYESAKLYVMLSSILLFAISLVCTRYPRHETRSKYLFLPDKKFYGTLIIAEILIFFVLVFVVVGFGEFLSSSRPGYQSGATVFIVLLFLGVVPILLKLSLGQRPGRGDYALFAMAVMMTSSFSRIHCIFYLTAVIYSAYYGMNIHTRPMALGTSLKAGSAALAGLLIFFGVGAIRDALNFTSSDFGSLISYIKDNPDKSLLSLDYNYTVGVEGMSGLAGAFTKMYDSPGAVNFDYGLVWMLRGALQWFPGPIKLYFIDIYSFVDTLNWYGDSIVPPGIESAFTSFGLFGIPIYAGMAYFFIWRRTSKQATDPSVRNLLFRYVGLGLMIFFTRGSWTVWVGYSITYYLILISTWFIFKRYIKVRS